MRLAWLGALLVLPALAHAERIALDKPIVQVGKGRLGGIGTILRYELVAPDRTNIAIVLLAPGRPGDVPFQVQVRDAAGNERQLMDSEGGDCTLVRTGLFRIAGQVVVVEAIKDWSSPYSLADATPMVVKAYRLERGGDPGVSDPVFRAAGQPIKTQMLCKLEDVDKAIEAFARRWK